MARDSCTFNNAPGSKIGVQMKEHTVHGSMNIDMSGNNLKVLFTASQPPETVQEEPTTAEGLMSRAEDWTQIAKDATEKAGEAVKKELADNGKSTTDSNTDKSNKSAPGSPTASDTVDGDSTDDENGTHHRGGFLEPQQSGSGTGGRRFYNFGNSRIAQQVGESNVTGTVRGYSRTGRWS